MSEEEQENPAAASEQAEVEPQDSQQPDEPQKMVPLAALEAERRKRQDSEAKAQLYQEYMLRAKDEATVSEEDDPTAIVEKKLLNETAASTKREILETLYQDMNPAAVQKINKYLKPILEKKPWLAASVDTALNRWARAAEIVEDYLHLVEDKSSKSSAKSDAARIVQNANKPRSPVEVGKSAQPTGTEYLKSIQGKKEFREYRQKMLRGEA